MFSIIPNLNENFYKWFSNSKVVDSNNQPMVMYHKSRSQELFDTFVIDGVTKNDYNNDYGVYFVIYAYKNSISYIADGVEFWCFLRIENPFFIFDYNSQPFDMYNNLLVHIDLNKNYCDSVLSLGHDGIIIRSKYYDQYLVFNPNQIKSVENNGEYSTTNDSIFT